MSTLLQMFSKEQNSAKKREKTRPRRHEDDKWLLSGISKQGEEKLEIFTHLTAWILNRKFNQIPSQTLSTC